MQQLNHIKLDQLCAKLQSLREERSALEEQISALNKEIIQSVGVNNTVNTYLYVVNVKTVERTIFDKSKFFDLFGETAYQRVVKQSSADIIYLSKPEGV